MQRLSETLRKVQKSTHENTCCFGSRGKNSKQPAWRFFSSALSFSRFGPPRRAAGLKGIVCFLCSAGYISAYEVHAEVFRFKNVSMSSSERCIKDIFMCTCHHGALSDEEEK